MPVCNVTMTAFGSGSPMAKGARVSVRLVARHAKSFVTEVPDKNGAGRTGARIVRKASGRYCKARMSCSSCGHKFLKEIEYE